MVCETTKGQVRLRLPEQRKVPRSLLEGSVPLAKKVRRSRSFLKEKSGRLLKILEVLESELSKLKLRVTMGIMSY